MKSKTIEKFDRYARDYDNWFNSPEGRVLFPIEVKAIKLFTKHDLTPPLLEIGVGTGAFASVLGIPFGIDPSFNMAKIAKMRGITVALVKGEELPFKDNTFGTIFMLLTICFLESPLKALKEAKRALKPDGKIILCIINKKSSWGRLYIKKKKEGHPIYSNARLFSYPEVKTLLNKLNLRIIGCSSTLLQHPSENLYYEMPKELLLPQAGFICLLAGGNP